MKGAISLKVPALSGTGEFKSAPAYSDRVKSPCTGNTSELFMSIWKIKIQLPWREKNKEIKKVALDIK